MKWTNERARQRNIKCSSHRMLWILMIRWTTREFLMTKRKRNSTIDFFSYIIDICFHHNNCSQIDIITMFFFYFCSRRQSYILIFFLFYFILYNFARQQRKIPIYNFLIYIVYVETYIQVSWIYLVYLEKKR